MPITRRARTARIGVSQPKQTRAKDVRLLLLRMPVRCGLAMKLKIFKENIASDIKLPVIHKDKEPPRVERLITS